MDYFDQDDAVLQYLLEIGAIAPEERAIAERRARAAALMGEPMPEGRMVGGHYIAPGWGAALMAGAKRAAGAYGDFLAGKEQKEIEARRRRALEALSQRKMRRSTGTDAYNPSDTGAY